jgi:hypothetical protein
MSDDDAQVPQLLPVLSRGRHRSPRKGACFMEMASYLAGERWSDHPACTHPLLAALARYVNDCTSDAGRPRLAVLIPSVIGLVDEDPRVDVRLALLCATRALPVVAAERQRVMAVAALACERALAEITGSAPGDLSASTRAALDQVPAAAAWAQRVTTQIPPSVRGLPRHGAPHVVAQAVLGIAQACIPDPDQALHDLLAAAVEEVASGAGRRTGRGAEPDAVRWAEACRLAGSVSA